MFKKLFLAGALAATGLFFFGANEAQAHNFGYRGFSYGPRIGVGYQVVPYRPVYRHVTPYRSYYGSPFHGRVYRSVPVYRSGYRGGFYYGGVGYPYGFGRRGISIGFGF